LGLQQLPTFSMAASRIATASRNYSRRDEPHDGRARHRAFRAQPLAARRGAEGLFGIQSWIALPEAFEETDPSFQHFDAASLPIVEDDGLRARVIAGSVFGSTSPVGMLSEWFYAEVSLAAGASAPLDAGHVCSSVSFVSKLLLHLCCSNSFMSDSIFADRGPKPTCTGARRVETRAPGKLAQYIFSRRE
jgi:hypothetical protein